MTNTDILSKIQLQLDAKKPFVVYCKPESDTITALFQKESKQYYLENFLDKGFVFAPFTGTKKAFIPAKASAIVTTKITKDVVQKDESYTEPSINQQAKHNFEQLVAQSIAVIKTGKFNKLVTSRTEHIAVDTNVAETYQRLLHAYPNAFRYCFYTPDTGLWMGATPEQLLKVKDDILQTVALAGTQLYKEGEKAVWESKEQEEQQIVTNYIVSSLKQYSNTINVTKPHTFRAGNIIHIKTDIKAKLEEATLLENIINKLHPTPAVCGLPKETAMQFLLDNEMYNREYYSGYLGEINHDFTLDAQNKTNLFVNLRCMKLTSSGVQLYIGCGITKDSDPEKEFFETVNKSITMRKVL
ncbi:isochorismate synthase [Flavobacterium litorale]|uniref:isochorismate synthase n=1 Tax=Flavobacterium litorale TaxID=2856519 RepID=A0ABX8V5J1_9FLAO|nr:isochorismate synthase [Flavobacterium litorale]QYJ68100.1 isochorismate synthase [Flavobacterium litorale]